jgi:Cu/Ag efflux protein CusF
MTRNSIVIAVLFAGAGLAFHAAADTSRIQLAQNEAKPAEAANAELTNGEVRKVDKATGKVTIKHGWVKKIDMPPMTMGYRVKDPALLDQLQPGDKIRFDVDRVDGAFTITRMEKVK